MNLRQEGLKMRLRQFLKEKNIKMFNLKKSSIINSIIYYKESYDLKDRIALKFKKENTETISI